MTELEKYQAINQADSIESLQEAFDKVFADEENILTRQGIEGRVSIHTPSHMNKEKMRDNIKALILDDKTPANKLTRRYGLRQQALYLQYYNKY